MNMSILWNNTCEHVNFMEQYSWACQCCGTVLINMSVLRKNAHEHVNVMVLYS